MTDSVLWFDIAQSTVGNHFKTLQLDGVKISVTNKNTGNPARHNRHVHLYHTVSLPQSEPHLGICLKERIIYRLWRQYG